MGAARTGAAVKKVLFAVTQYNTLTHTFIYEQLIHLTRFRGSVVAQKKIINLDAFPFAPVHTLASASPFVRFWNQKICFPLLKRLPFFEKIIAQEAPDVIHAHFGGMANKIYRSARRFGIPLITYFYGHDLPKIRRKKGRRKLFQAGTFFLVLSKDMQADVLALGCPSHKIRVLDVGIDLAKFPIRAQEPDRKVFTALSVARFVEKKGIRYLIEAIGLLKSSEPNLRCRLVGDGPLRADLEERIKRLGVEDRVEITGYVPYASLADEYRQAHCFVLPSLTDRQGERGEMATATKQALATGLPVITTDHAGIGETFKNGEHGILVPERDAQALAAALRKIIADPLLAHRVAASGRALVESTFDVRKVVAQMEDIYAEAIALQGIHAD
jgi:glycosyltransferase involved in cell wall biosynthesis